MSFLTVNPVSVDTPTKKSQYDSVFENTQLASRTLVTSISSSSAIATTAVETTFSKNWTLPANTITRVGSILTVRVAGKFSTTGTPTLRIRLKIGTDVILDSSALTTPTGASTYAWHAEQRVLCRSLSNASQLLLGGFFFFRQIGGSTWSSPLMGTPEQPDTFFQCDFTIANSIICTALWGTSSASNTITMDGFAVELAIPENTI